ncbi:MAG TPA: TolC family protein [Candidatus Limnocylindria bacterium]|nr:TolC family protein [Candidatus Limnocylindria bacterium]
MSVRRTAALTALALVLGTRPAFAQTPTPFAFTGLSLDLAERDAVAHSPDVSAADAVVRENDAALAAVRSALGPQLVGGYVTSPQAGASPNTTILSQIASVGVQTTIGDIAAYSPLVAAALANLRNAQSGLASAQRGERLKVVNLYYDALKARAIRGARESALSIANEQLHAAQIRFAAGDAPKLDVVRANVAVAKTTADAELARVADLNATEALRVETGVADTAFTSTAAAAPPEAPALDPQAAVTRAQLLRPELIAARRTTEAAQASARAARRAQLPALTVGAGYAAGTDSGQHVAAPTVNVTLNLPLSGAARARVDEADAVVAEDQAKADATARAIDLEVSAAARNLAAAQRATAATTEARRQAEAELSATQLGYRNGASSSLELSTARDVYAQAVVDELSAFYDEARARATLSLEVGG